MQDIIYKYYILPLRVFLINFKRTGTAGENVQLSFYFFGVVLGHSPIFFPFLLHYFLNNYSSNYEAIIVRLMVILFFACAIYAGNRVARYFLTKYPLSIDAVNNKDLFWVGAIIYSEWIIALVTCAYLVPR